MKWALFKSGLVPCVLTEHAKALGMNFRIVACNQTGEMFFAKDERTKEEAIAFSEGYVRSDPSVAIMIYDDKICRYNFHPAVH